jgi:hypothetical protein
MSIPVFESAGIVRKRLIFFSFLHFRELAVVSSEGLIGPMRTTDDRPKLDAVLFCDPSPAMATVLERDDFIEAASRGRSEGVRDEQAGHTPDGSAAVAFPKLSRVGPSPARSPSRRAAGRKVRHFRYRNHSLCDRAPRNRPRARSPRPPETILPQKTVHVLHTLDSKRERLAILFSPTCRTRGVAGGRIILNREANTPRSNKRPIKSHRQPTGCRPGTRDPVCTSLAAASG